MQSRTAVLATTVITASLLACKALSSSGADQTNPVASASAVPAPPAAAPPSIAGVYQGTFTRKDGQSGRLVGVVTSSGDARFVADGDVQEVGKLELSGLDVSGRLETFSRGSSRETLTLTGKLSPDGSLSGSFSAASGGGTFRLSRSTKHDGPGSLAELAGTWVGATGFRLSVDDAGAFTGRDGSPCHYSGKFTLADPKLEAFSFDLEVKRCGKFDGSYKGSAVVNDAKLAFGVSGERFARSGYLTKK